MLAKSETVSAVLRVKPDIALPTPEATIRDLLMSELHKRVDVRRLTVLQIDLPLHVGRAGYC
jgi:hypothetical protein